jgi:hypothetical protein
MTASPLTFLLSRVLPWLLAGAAAAGQAPAAGRAAERAETGIGAILPAFPKTPDPGRRYLVYLHGRIVEEQGRRASSPEFGAYDYDGIVQALAGSGTVVIGEIRSKDADPQASARHVADEVRRLLAAGVPARSITIVGASKGAVIAMLASTALPDPDLGWVLLASCNDAIGRQFEISLHGQVLSIFESSDEIGGSCSGFFARSPELGRHDEVRLETGLRHGFLYRPLAEWVEPARTWALDRALPGR